MKCICKFSIISHASALAYSSAITYIVVNQQRILYNSKERDLVYIISPLTSQLHTTSHKVAIKYVGPVVIYKIIDPHNYLIMTLDGNILRGLF